MANSKRSNIIAFPLARLDGVKPVRRIILTRGGKFVSIADPAATGTIVALKEELKRLQARTGGIIPS